MKRWAGVAGLAASLATVHAATSDIEVDGVTWRTVELAQEAFVDPNWRERWMLEGNAKVEVNGGGLLVETSKDPEVEPAATLWWRQPLPANVLVEMTAEVLGPSEGNAANVNLFFHARETDGTAYRGGRNGRYADYHQIPNYIMTLTGGFQEGWARLRKNPGFALISEDKTLRSEVGATYRIRVMVTEGRLRYWVDGRLIHDVRDPEPLPGGHFALRTWRSRVRWSDLRIAALEPASTGAAGALAWPETFAPLSRPWRPRDKMVSQQNPPDFSWPALEGAEAYDVSVALGIPKVAAVIDGRDRQVPRTRWSADAEDVALAIEPGWHRFRFEQAR